MSAPATGGSSSLAVLLLSYGLAGIGTVDHPRPVRGTCHVRYQGVVRRTEEPR